MGISKYVLPVVIGTIFGTILITFGEMMIHQVYPLPKGADLYEADTVVNYYKQLPADAFKFFVINNAICSVIAGIIATLFAERSTVKPALVAGFVLSLAGLYKVVVYPQPLWCSVSTMLTFLPLTYVGGLLVKKKPGGNNNIV